MDQAIRPGDVAHAMGVSPQTVSTWLKEGRLRYEQDYGARKAIPISELFRFSEERGLKGSAAEQRMRDRLMHEILPKYRKSA